MEHYCTICNKNYSSYKSLWNHNKIFHISQNTQKSSIILNPSSKSLKNSHISTSETNNSNIKLKCKYCNKLCSRSDNLNRHELKCKVKLSNETKLKEENELLKNELNNFKNDMMEMQKQLINVLNQNKIHPKTLNKINNNCNNNSNNKIINNTYVKFDRVDISKVLSKKEIVGILNKKLQSLEEVIKLVHFNEKLPEYSNIYITNMRYNNAYVFNGTNFITVSKDEVINDLINNYSEEIELSFDTYKNKLSEHTVKRLEVFLEQLNSDDKFVDSSNKAYSNYKLYKVANIKRLIYDNSDAKKLLSLNKMELEEKELKNTEESDSEDNISV
jgi:hypothetical protein